MSYLEELLPEFRKGAKIKYKGWNNSTYIKMNKNTGEITTNEGRRYIFSYEDFTHSCWEFYQEPIDWDYIIENKCLCWFWDSDEFSILGYLVKKGYDELIEPKYKDYIYKELNGRWWKNCRPVRRDEVTFYEDRKYE